MGMGSNHEGAKVCRSEHEVKAAIIKFSNGHKDVRITGWPVEKAVFPYRVDCYFFEHSSIYVPEAYLKIEVRRVFDLRGL
jgi:hypothetical protein